MEVVTSAQFLQNRELARVMISADLETLAVLRRGKPLEAAELPRQLAWYSVMEIYTREVLRPATGNFFRKEPQILRGEKRDFETPRQLRNWLVGSTGPLVRLTADLGREFTGKTLSRAAWRALISEQILGKIAADVASELIGASPRLTLEEAEKFANQFGDPLNTRVRFQSDDYGRISRVRETCCYKDGRGKAMCRACHRQELSIGFQRSAV